MVLGLSLCATLSLAQVPDSITVALPLPRTEAEFLARYGANDSNRALIRWWFRRRHLNHALIGTSAAMFAVGVTVPSQLNKKGLIGEANTIGIVGALGGGVVLISSLSANKRWRTARLNELLNDPKSIDPVMLARAGVPVRAQGFDQLLATSNQRDTSHAKRLSKRQRLMGAYLSVYGHSDSNRKLIRYWFRQRRTSVVLTAVGVPMTVFGLSLYAETAGYNLGAAGLSASTGGLIDPPKEEVNGSAHVFFWGGATLSLVGIVNRASHRFSRLNLALQNPGSLTEEKWKRVLSKKYPKN